MSREIPPSSLKNLPQRVQRSEDSNAEDLEGFAGAGLFESVCAEEDRDDANEVVVLITPPGRVVR